MDNLALIVVDMQNDFMDDGVLGVKGAKSIVPAINEYMSLFHHHGLPIFATRDWHPQNHISFRDRGGPWPPHCIMFTEGASFYSKLKFPDETEVISKGSRPDEEAYSGFHGTDLESRLKSKGVKSIFVSGVATEYCVFSTAMDGLKNGFKVYLLADAVKGIKESDSQSAISKMKNSGIKIISYKELEELLKRPEQAVV